MRTAVCRIRCGQCKWPPAHVQARHGLLTNKQTCARVGSVLFLACVSSPDEGQHEKNAPPLATHETTKSSQFGAFGGDTAYSSEALTFLLKGGRNVLAGGGGDDPPPADWLSESAWRMVLELSSLDGCGDRVPSVVGIPTLCMPAASFSCSRHLVRAQFSSARTFVLRVGCLPLWATACGRASRVKPGLVHFLRLSMRKCVSSLGVAGHISRCRFLSVGKALQSPFSALCSQRVSPFTMLYYQRH